MKTKLCELDTAPSPMVGVERTGDWKWRKDLSVPRSMPGCIAGDIDGQVDIF